MPKMTQKYTRALSVARQEGIPGRQIDRDALYNALLDKGYQWSCTSMEWMYVGNVPIDESLDLLHLRIWCAGDRVETIASGIASAMVEAGCVLIEQSGPHPCRPPKQAESRVYLTMQIPER